MHPYSRANYLHAYLLIRAYLPGTRGSFVKAFQVFEERELERSDQSESVKNTMKLHSNKTKNVLATAKRTTRNL